MWYIDYIHKWLSLAEQRYQLIYYVAESGKVPFRDWFESLNDFKTQAVIEARLARLRVGNFGKCEPVGLGVFELKIDYGPGYRIYFARAGRQAVLLLWGGAKSTQRKDIRKAHQYWKDYREANHE